jgi:hypothetical protein
MFYLLKISMLMRFNVDGGDSYCFFNKSIQNEFAYSSSDGLKWIADISRNSIISESVV